MMRQRTRKWHMRALAYLQLAAQNAHAAKQFRLRFHRIEMFDRAVAEEIAQRRLADEPKAKTTRPKAGPKAHAKAEARRSRR